MAAETLAATKPLLPMPPSSPPKIRLLKKRTKKHTAEQLKKTMTEKAMLPGGTA